MVCKHEDLGGVAKIPQSNGEQDLSQWMTYSVWAAGSNLFWSDKGQKGHNCFVRLKILKDPLYFPFLGSPTPRAILHSHIKSCQRSGWSQKSSSSNLKFRIQDKFSKILIGGEFHLLIRMDTYQALKDNPKFQVGYWWLVVGRNILVQACLPPTVNEGHDHTPNVFL